MEEIKSNKRLIVFVGPDVEKCIDLAKVWCEVETSTKGYFNAFHGGIVSDAHRAESIDWCIGDAEEWLHHEYGIVGVSGNFDKYDMWPFVDMATAYGYNIHSVQVDPISGPDEKQLNVLVSWRNISERV